MSEHLDSNRTAMPTDHRAIRSRRFLAGTIARPDDETERMARDDAEARVSVPERQGRKGRVK